MKLATIGLGFIKTSKKGNTYISVTFADDVLENVYKEDLIKKICIFERTSKAGKKYYAVTCPVKDDYEPHINLGSKQAREPNQQKLG
jgi:hypothetical protein